VGIAGVLAFSVSGRTREFGIRLAIGSEPRHLLTSVIAEGVVIAVVGVVAGAACGLALAQLAGSYFADTRLPGAVPGAGSVVVPVAAAVVASVLLAARAARVDVMQALRSGSITGRPVSSVFKDLQECTLDRIWTLERRLDRFLDLPGPKSACEQVQEFFTGTIFGTLLTPRARANCDAPPNFSSSEDGFVAI